MIGSVSEAADIVVGQPRRCGFLNLRGDLAGGLSASVAAAFGVELPATPGSYRRSDARAAYWLAPDEWLLAMPDGEQTAVEARLRDGLAGHFSIADVSGGLVCLGLAGGGARMVLQQASAYDFHPKAFGAGRCVQTTFAKATALVVADGDGGFELVVRGSYADYIRRWIENAIRLRVGDSS